MGTTTSPGVSAASTLMMAGFLNHGVNNTTITFSVTGVTAPGVLSTDSVVSNMTNVSSTAGNTTEGPLDRPPTKQEMIDFYIGLFLAVSSSLFIGTSFIFKKLGLLRLAKNSATRAGQGGYGYLREWMWWAGMILMTLGEFANFAAYAFAPATLVTPLGALSVLVSAILASRVLKERLNLLGKLGCLLCVLGSTVMVIHSPREQEVASIAALRDMVIQPGFIVYGVLVLVGAVVLMVHTAPRYGSRNVLVYIAICSSLGSFTVMGCKGVGVGLKQTFRGHNQFTNWMFYVLLAVVVVCILIQLNYLNRALDTFNTAVVTPIYYVFFTSLVMVASLILFKEWGTMHIEDILGDLSGFLTIVVGIFLLNAFKDFNISLRSLPFWKKDESSSSSSTENNNSLATTTDDNAHLLENGQLESIQAEVMATEYRDSPDEAVA
ncbi:magnesium transporter NIPA2-like [Babylonia areolata]|uniref:magnesium transporter NIPA2-like n=1 Tax=Babylonia areolata TaxID=304850 RepID=UPI003FCEF01D